MTPLRDLCFSVRQGADPAADARLGRLDAGTGIRYPREIISGFRYFFDLNFRYRSASPLGEPGGARQARRGDDARRIVHHAYAELRPDWLAGLPGPWRPDMVTGQYERAGIANAGGVALQDPVPTPSRRGVAAGTRRDVFFRADSGESTASRAAARFAHKKQRTPPVKRLTMPRAGSLAAIVSFCNAAAASDVNLAVVAQPSSSHVSGDTSLIFSTRPWPTA